MTNIYSQSGQVSYGIKVYTVDTETDKDNLPTKDKMGTKVYVIESKKWYMLNGSNEWVPFVPEDGSADAILDSVKNMSAEQKADFKEELNIEGGGGEVTPASIVTATGQMSNAQKAATTQNIGAVSDSEFTPTVILLSVDGGTVELDLSGIGLTVQQFLEAYIAGKRFFFVLVKGNGVVSLTPSYLDVTNTRIVLTGYDNGSLYVTDLSAEGAQVMIGSLEALPSTESLQLTATPTAGPDDDTLMSGTWSGATWEEVVAAIQNSRLIQVDVTNIGKIALLYNLGSATNAASIAYVYKVGDTLYNVFAELFIDSGGNHQFKLSIINARTKTENVSGTTPTITPAPNTIYNCGELVSMTISNPPAEGKYSIIFYSGANPTATVGIENFVAEANKRYKITVEDNYATYDSWPYTP